MVKDGQHSDGYMWPLLMQILCYLWSHRRFPGLGTHHEWRTIVRKNRNQICGLSAADSSEHPYQLAAS